MAPTPPTYFQRAPMSPVPPSRVSSSIPHPIPQHPPLPRKPLMRLHLDDLSHESTVAFLSAVNPTTLLQEATATVLKWLYDMVEEDENAPVAPPSPSPWPSIRSVTLILRPLSGVAHTTALRIDEDHKEIHLSLEYLTRVVADAREPSSSARLRHEITGVIVHEMVHVWQSYGEGSAPGGLTEGIADWVRLRAGLAPPHWKRRAAADGKHWDDGYETTAWFLEYLESVRVGQGTVRRCNQMLRDGHYHEGEFWNRLCGDDVENLWQEYSTWLGQQSTPFEQLHNNA